MQEWGAEECATRASVMAREELTWRFMVWDIHLVRLASPDPATKKHSVRAIPFEHMGGVFIVIDL